MIPTLRDDPQDAEIASHKLMLRAGLIRKLVGGLYTFLPLGLRALRKIEAIIRKEMDNAGALEILMPALQPREIWDRSERFEVLGEVMYQLTDRQGREMVLGPTHEEVMTGLVAREINSYRQLPCTFYQIQTKFRDEIRPRFGLMRSKEFIMKDAYSFDLSWDEADASYETMYGAYTRIFERCGLQTTVVEADTGAMGGKWSHEFMVLAPSGEDGIVRCDACGYAANVERAERRFCPPVATPLAAGSTPQRIETPACRTIEEVSAFLGCDASQLVKTLIYLVDGKPAAALVAGHRDINDGKLLRALDAKTVVLADDETIRRVSGAPVGFAGPVGLQIPVYADVGLRKFGPAVVGANEADTHLTGVVLERDAAINAFHDLAVAREGDGCPRCDGSLREQRGIEVGHVFKLGTQYSESFDARYLDESGRARPLVMGCYGIGVTRVLQAIVEQNRDDDGICWPAAVAPYQVVVLALDPGDEVVMNVAVSLTEALSARSVDVLLDDRDERPGVKFKDADLLGFPLRVVVGAKSLAKQSVEIKSRSAQDAELVNVAKSEEALIEMIRRMV